ncbi:MAG TPA: Uma2 family endonuclease [Clostridiales bacterium]|nr:Uma2 family endonuclease [Clostridiales bacterium]
MSSITVNLSFHRDFLQQIDAMAKAESRSRSEFIRQAVRSYMNEYRDQQWVNDRVSCVSRVKGAVRDRAVRDRTAEPAVPYTASETEKGYTYADYLGWPEDERWEIIGGVPYNMSPAPSYDHQSISAALTSLFYFFMKGKPCKVLAAPFDLRIPPWPDAPDEEIRDVVQPDLLVVCDRNKLDKRGCKGSPDLVAEILSPATSLKDVTAKFDLYERIGVREYWVIRPDEHSVTVFLPGSDQRFDRTRIYKGGDSVPVEIFNGNLVIDLAEIFA